MTAISSSKNLRYVVSTFIFITVFVLTKHAFQYKASLIKNIHQQIEDTFTTSYAPKEFKDPHVQGVYTVTITSILTSITSSTTTVIETSTVTSIDGSEATGVSAKLMLAREEDDDDVDYTSHSPDTFDVVLNMYKENATELAMQMEAIRALSMIKDYSDVRVFVYSKDDTADLDELKDILGATEIVLRPNKGRESGSFLSHIIEHWDELGAHTYFRQAEMHHYSDAMRKITDYLVPPQEDGSDHTGMLSLGWLNRVSCSTAADQWDSWRRIPQLYSAIHGVLCPEDIVLTYLGQFIVSRKRIKQNRKALYVELLDTLNADMDHWIHKDPRNGFGDDTNAPYFGHTMERLWMVLFRCSDSTLTDTCGNGLHSLFSARGPDDPINKCQCMDEP